MRATDRRLVHAALAAVLVVAAMGFVGPAVASDDPRFHEQWGLAQIGAPEAWARSKGAGVKIGIVDSGVDAEHPDLAGKIDAQANCLKGPCVEESVPDDDGHGTVVAGIAAARTENRTGVAGVAPDAHLVIAKVIDADGAGTTESINNGIRWVVDHGARVVNLSLGDPDEVFVRLVGTGLASGIEYAWSRGAIPVLASGNYRDGLSEQGAAYGNLDAVVVGATDRKGGVAFYSSPLGNAKWGVVAPGGDGETPVDGILAPIPGGGYEAVSGTSMAAPHVSGTLALLLAQGRSPSAAVAALLEGLDHSTSCGQGCKGRLQAAAATAVATGAPGSTTLIPSGRTTKPDSNGGLGAGLGFVIIALVLLGLVGAGVALAVVRRRR